MVEFDLLKYCNVHCTNEKENFQIRKKFKENKATILFQPTYEIFAPHARLNEYFKKARDFQKRSFHKKVSTRLPAEKTRRELLFKYKFHQKNTSIIPPRTEIT